MRRAATAGVAALSIGAVAVPAITAAQSTGARDITVREKVQSITFVHQKRTTKGDHLATGDRVLTRQQLFDAGSKRVGSLYTDCVNVGRPARVFAATVQCVASYRFADGQLVATGVLRLGAPGASAPLTGSGSYRGVRGEVTSAPPAQGFDVDVLHLDG
jgi:hypothetical protein